jgi:hypothetical protein
VAFSRSPNLAQKFLNLRFLAANPIRRIFVVAVRLIIEETRDSIGNSGPSIFKLREPFPRRGHINPQVQMLIMVLAQKFLNLTVSCGFMDLILSRFRLGRCLKMRLRVPA